jgi:hypothetical protein
MANLNKISDVWVVHRKPRKNSKIILQLFKDTRVDDIIGLSKRIPLIPNENEILDVGVGENFGELFTKKYKL